MSVGHLYVFFGKISIQILCPFFNRVVWLFDVELYKFFVYLILTSYQIYCLQIPSPTQ